MTEDQRKIAEQQSLSGINKLWNALIPLTHLGSFMNTGAHPDDERSHILTLLREIFFYSKKAQVT